MSKRRILFVIENDTYGGGEKGFAQIINGLDADKFEIFTACRPEGLFVEKIRGASTVIPFNLRSKFNLLNILKLAAIIKRNKIDLVHCQGARTDFYARLAAKAAGIPVVSTVQMPVEGFDSGALRKAFYILADRFSSLFCDQVIVVSPELEKFVLDKRGLPARKVRLIYNAPGPEFFAEPPAKENKKTWAGAGGRLVIGAAARLVRQKGFSYLVDALKLIKNEVPELSEKLTCVIAGEGELKGPLTVQASDAGLTNVLFSGFTERPEEFIRGLDVFVLPSLKEGQPNALLEAMALGRTIIASDIVGVRGTVTDGFDALLVPPGDAPALAAAIKKIAADPGFSEKLGNNARETARDKFPHKVFIIEHEKLYGELTDMKTEVR